MRSLLVSKHGDGVPIAILMSRQGDEVDVAIEDPKARVVGEGLVNHIEFPDLSNPHIKIASYDLIWFDMVGFGKEAEALMKAGFNVFGAGRLADRLELDRNFGMSVMKGAGISTPTTKSFTDYDEAITFVRQEKKRYVYKPNDNQSTLHTYVAKGWKDMIGMLDLFRKDNVPFILQEVVEGIEVSTELWFNGSSVVHVNHTMEDKRLFPGDIGPQTGCMGNVVWVGKEQSRLYTQGIGRLVPILKKAHYYGPIDLNTIVSEKVLKGLEFTARLGYDAIFALLEGIRPNVSKLFRDVTLARKPSFKPLTEWMVAVRVSVPPYPHDGDSNRGLPITGITSESLKHVWLGDVMFRHGEYQVAGFDGVALIVAARGDSSDFGLVKEARRRAYRTISNLHIPDMQYRNDIGVRVDANYARLKEWGWL